MNLKSKLGAAALALLTIGSLAACTSNHHTAASTAQQAAKSVADTRANYIPKNDIEGKNYNARQKIADDPTTILWCTAFPTNQNTAAFTVPIVGKLTSSNKRPYPTSQTEVFSNNDGGTYSPELPGSDGMYGASTEYRYGFRPDGQYVDFTGLETYCTTEPTIFQRTKTVIDLQSDTNLTNASAAAQAALKQGNKALAQQLLVASLAGK